MSFIYASLACTYSTRSCAALISLFGWWWWGRFWAGSVIMVNMKERLMTLGTLKLDRGWHPKKPPTSKRLFCESCCAVVFPEKSKHFCIWWWSCPKLSLCFNMMPKIYLNKGKKPSRHMVFKEVIFDFQGIVVYKDIQKARTKIIKIIISSWINMNHVKAAGTLHLSHIIH